jgi:hypothetical protein
MNDSLKTFYVTFGSGTLFANHHAVIQARDRDIVCAWLNKERYRWSNISTTVPKYTVPLEGKPFELYYQSAVHV